MTTEAGRMLRPLFHVGALREIAADKTGALLKQIHSQKTWEDLLLWSTPGGEHLIEYIDPGETESAFIAMKAEEAVAVGASDYTHAEIHPSTALGTLASNIPFPDHNQSPRNSYQCLGLDEKVRMVDGSERRIADVAVGDEVITFDPKTFETTTTRVVNQFVRPANTNVYKLFLADSSTIVATEDHKFIMSIETTGTHSWKRVEEAIQHFRKAFIWKFDTEMKAIPVLIEGFETLQPSTLVSDITVQHENHSFITSGGILSSNCAMGKQAMGMFALNFRERFDALAHMLCYPQVPFVSPFMSRFYGAQAMPAGQNIVVAIMTYTGYNQEDSVMFNRAFLERGGFRSIFYRTYKDEERKNQSSSEEEQFTRPDPSLTKQMKNANYEKLDESGFVPENTYVDTDDILIGKIVPLRVPTGMVIPVGAKRFRDVSRTMRNNEIGWVDRIFKNRNGEGYSFAKVRMRQDRIPEIGDKVSSRHGQKGTVGMILNPEDMPQTASGIVPDIIINPHCIPSRMTIAQLMETLLGKMGAELGCLGDGSPFNEVTLEKITTILRDQLGMEPQGNEILYNGYTGRQMETSIFVGPVYYQRLRHCSADKMHSRSSGPLVMLTRQPAEGRAREGGLRFGEMERDCVACSDLFRCWSCRDCGLIAIVNPKEGIWNCRGCGNSVNFSAIEIPYAYKLMLQELETMCISSRIVTQQKLLRGLEKVEP
jgi:DNA-directed RNA polymerase beta subunit